MSRRVGSLLALRCVALLVAAVAVLPVCAHIADETVAAGGMPVPVVAITVDTVSEPGWEHECPGPAHGPGDAGCRPVVRAVTGATSPTPVPPAKAVDLAAAVLKAATAPPRGSARTRGVTPGIHQLQVQRI
ncbi:hypothetical protein [Streptomyces sp. STR69]|uniref:hypothetical protein n=1 Tax=Streptomyces sp. STR69 TaxID=1796942 RepID=UPI0021C940A5|nr:hypothetical protein [Streptomyces sp. STR69]